MLPRQRLTKEKPILGIRDLTREDLPLLREKRQVVDAVATFRETHHRVARLVAAGLRHHEVANATGYSYQRIATLAVDPAFQELVATYRGKIDANFLESQDAFYETATANMRMAEAMIAKKLEDAQDLGETLPTKDLIAITADRMDRFGYGKKNTTLNVNADFASMLEQTIRRSSAARDITPSPTEPSTASPALAPESDPARSPNARTPGQGQLIEEDGK